MRRLSLLLLVVLVAACGGGGHPTRSASTPRPSLVPSVSPSVTVSPVLQFSGFGEQSFLLGCDEVEIASRQIAGHDPESSVVSTLSDVAASWGKLRVSALQPYAAGLRGAVTDGATRRGVVAGALSLCAANGYTPSP